VSATVSHLFDICAGPPDRNPLVSTAGRPSPIRPIKRSTPTFAARSRTGTCGPTVDSPRAVL